MRLSNRESEWMDILCVVELDKYIKPMMADRNGTTDFRKEGRRAVGSEMNVSSGHTSTCLESKLPRKCLMHI